EHAIGMLTAGISSRAVAGELNVHFSTISRLQRRFREFGSTFNRPHNRRPRITTPAQNLHIQHLHLRDRLRPATQTAAATIGLQPKNFCTNSHLHACHSHRGLDLTAVHRRSQLERQMLTFDALWRGVLFMDESRFSLYRADGRQRVWCCVGERFADVSVVDRVAHGGGGVMVWAGVCYGQRTQVHFIEYRDEIPRPIVVALIHNHHLMLQHDHARPHVARISYSPDMSPIEHVWDALDRRIRQRVEEESTLCEGDVLHCVKQMVVTPDTDWFSDPPNTVKLHIL
ncbi:hypothetical protein M9458_053754, partial [Cirrhinus mrigala]